MGNYYCKKCSVPLYYYSNIETSMRNNCREHCLLDNECKDCDNSGNCRHDFKYYVFCCYW